MDWQPGYPVDCRGDLIASRARSGPYGDVEFDAGRIVARSTGARVTLADDNSRPRTPDLLIQYADGRLGVGEIVTVTDQHRAAETSDWMAGGLDLYSERLAWEWWVTAPARVNRQRLRAPILRVLEEMEGLHERPQMLAPIDPNTAGPGALKLLALGMTEAAGNDQPGERRGVVHWQPEGIGGEPAPDVDGFQTWLDDFLNGTLAQDKILKIIAAPGDHEGHLLVGVSWSAPWAVIRLLEEDIDVLPVKAPRLPAEVGHLWIWACQSSGRALAWAPDRGWFDVARSWVTE